MKPLFYSALYVSVGMGALVFSTWLFVHFELQAEEGGMPSFPPAPQKKEDVLGIPEAQAGTEGGEALPAPTQPEFSQNPAPPSVPQEGDISLPDVFPTLPDMGFSEQGGGERHPASLNPSASEDLLSDVPEEERGASQEVRQERGPSSHKEEKITVEDERDGIGEEDTPDGIKSKIRSRVSYIQQVLSEYHYDPTQKRNPFVPPLSEQPPALPQRTQEVQPQPITMEEEEGPAPYIPTPSEMYELKDMHLVGITWGKGFGASKAFFRDPSRTIHELQKNDRIGKNKGIIYQIREDEVVILEERIGQEQAYVPVIVTLNRLEQIR